MYSNSYLTLFSNTGEQITPYQEKILNEVLMEYEKIAQSDPVTLLSLIPPTELWRLFIDGVQQEHGRGLHLLKSFQQVPENIDPDSWRDTGIDQYDDYSEEVVNLDETLDKYVEKNGTFILDILKNRQWELTAEEVKTLTIRDLLNMDRAWLPYERNEPGYLLAMCTASQKVYDSEFSFEKILTFHDLSTNRVKMQHYDAKKNEKRNEFRFDTINGFRFDKKLNNPGRNY